MKDAVQSIGSSLLLQFDVLADALEQAIRLCPDDQWAVEGNAAGAPVRQIYHILGALDTYCMKRSWGWDERFLDIDGHFSWDRELANPPDRSELLDYLSRLRSHIRQWVAGNDNEVYLSPTQENLRGECLLDEMLYILRHSQQHLGEIEIEYLLRELPTPEWKW